MIYAMFDYQGGIANFVGLTIFQPFWAILLSILTVIVCGLVGLPIRLNKRLHNWWRTNYYFSILIGFIGLIACGISLMPEFVEVVTFRMEGMNMKHTVPNQSLSISGWFLVAIGTLHVYPPIILEQKLLVLLNSAKQSNFKT